MDVSKLSSEEKITVGWQRKPIYIVKRSASTLAQLKKTNIILRDPNSIEPQQPEIAKNFHRSIEPEILVVVGICTRLDCNPEYHPPGSNILYTDEFKNDGLFYCGCCSSKYDLSGRVIKNVPALKKLISSRIRDSQW